MGYLIPRPGVSLHVHVMVCLYPSMLIFGTERMQEDSNGMIKLQNCKLTGWPLANWGKMVYTDQD